MTSEMNHGENNSGETKNLIASHKIKIENIDVNAYFLSLTDNALAAGLLTEKDVEYMQTQIYDILSDNTWMHTNGTSTSVTSEEAKGLILAILHALDCFCMANSHELDELINMLKEKAGIKKCYSKGLEFVKRENKYYYDPTAEFLKSL